MFIGRYHLVSPYAVDKLKFGIPMASGVILYAVYLLMNYINTATSQYVVKMSYSKDKVKIHFY